MTVMGRAFRRIVVPVDFSAGSNAALAAVERLRAPGLRVELVHAVNPVILSGGIPDPVWTDVLGQMEGAARRDLARLVTRVGSRLGAGVRVRAHLVNGAPADAICRFADKVRADLVVIGTHGRTGLAHVVLGSVAERVVRLSRRPVLTVPIRGRRGR